MATGADLLQAIDDLDDGLRASSGGSDETRALRALNRAQDQMEMVIAAVPQILSDVQTITLTASQETSEVPTRTRRIDALWFIDPSTSRPQYEIKPNTKPGAHRVGSPDPIVANTSNVSGRPTMYWYDGDTTVYWDRDPPNSTDTVRVVGFFGGEDITTSTTFPYSDEFIIPVAQIALKFFLLRQDDSVAEITAYTQEVLGTIIASLQRRWRHGPAYATQYTRNHEV